MKPIVIHHAYEGNLKNISLEIPRNKITVLTGLSGSGKTTLAVDVLYQECQRQYLEAMNYQGIPKPKVEAIEYTSPAILITQKDFNRNPRSSLGTFTDMYTDLRMIYEKLSVSECPLCHQRIEATRCKEILVKSKDDFIVYIDCPHCHQRIEKLTRSFFSYNTRQGACPTCQGMGKIMNVDLNKVLNENLSLENGAVSCWPAKYNEYQIDILSRAFAYYGISYLPNTPISQFSEIQRELLLNGVESCIVKSTYPNMKTPKTAQNGKFEGLITALKRKHAEKSTTVTQYFVEEPCPECLGERIQARSRSALLFNKRLPQVSQLSLQALQTWLTELEKNLSIEEQTLVASYLLDLQTKINRLMMVGLAYLTLDRSIKTLSGGEAQRVKLAAALDASIMGIVYILDEPTVGLHPKDTVGMLHILKQLRDLGNTLVIIEHDLDIIKAADYIADFGPGAGQFGGEIIATGSFEELLKQSRSITGTYFSKKETMELKTYQQPTQFISIQHAKEHNLKDISVDIPINQLTLITGVSGTGKSTLIFDVLAKSIPDQKNHLDQFDEIVTLRQDTITRMKRSNIATYTGIYTDIRKLFANMAKDIHPAVTIEAFSFNSKGGRCEYCEGLGTVVSNMLFFKDLEVTCPICHGQQFQPHILAIKYHSLNIKEVLNLSLSDALCFFNDQPSLKQKLILLNKIGLGYLTLGQTLTTLSGGEGQRLKLAKSLFTKKTKKVLYLLDEPTTGLHPKDIENFLTLLNELVKTGHTFIVIEHNLQMIKAADWLIDLGLEGGEQGGEVLFQGRMNDLLKCKKSYTADYLRKDLNIIL